MLTACGAHLQVHPAEHDAARASAVGPENSSSNWRLLFVQEYFDGGTLKDAIAAGFFQLADTHEPHMPHILQVAWAISSGLQYLHAKDILHGS